MWAINHSTSSTCDFGINRNHRYLVSHYIGHISQYHSTLLSDCIPPLAVTEWIYSTLIILLHIIITIFPNILQLVNFYSYMFAVHSNCLDGGELAHLHSTAQFCFYLFPSPSSSLPPSLAPQPFCKGSLSLVPITCIACPIV